MRDLLSVFIPKHLGARNVVGDVIRGASIALLIQIAGNGIGFFSQILLAQWLGVSHYGILSYLITWAQVLTIGALVGMDLGVLRFIPEYLVHRDRSHLRGIIRWSRRIVGGMGGLLVAASMVALFIIRPIQSSTIAIWMGSLLIPLFALSEIQTEIIRSIKWIAWAYGPPILLQPVLFLCLTYGLLKIADAGRDYIALIALIVSICLISIIQWAVIRKAFSHHMEGAPAAYDGRGWLKVSFPLLVNSIFSIIMIRVDILLVGFFLGSEEVGIYSAAVKTATVIGITLSAANTIVAPMITTFYTRRDIAGLQNIVSMATLFSFWSSFFLGTGVIVVSEPLMRAFGSEFIRAQWPLILLICGQLFNVGSGSVGLLMVLTGHERQSAKILGYCALITCGVCFLAIPAFGLVGAAAASITGLIIWNIWMYRKLVANLGIRPSILFAMRRVFSMKE